MEDLITDIICYLDIQTTYTISSITKSTNRLIYHCAEINIRTHDILIYHDLAVTVEYCPCLPRFKFLKSLYLDDVSEIHDISIFLHLEDLILYYNRSITNISSLTNLRRLELSSNYSILDLNSLSQLEILDLSFNRKITNISSLINLKELHLLYDTSGIEISCLTNLERLYLKNINITTNQLRYLTNLNYLSLINTSCVNNISSLTNLTYLELGADHDLKDLTMLPKLQTVRNVWSRYIPLVNSTVKII